MRKELNPDDQKSISGGYIYTTHFPRCKICGFYGPDGVCDHLMRQHTHRKAATYYCNECQRKKGSLHPDAWWSSEGDACSGLMGHMYSTHLEYIEK